MRWEHSFEPLSTGLLKLYGSAYGELMKKRIDEYSDIRKISFSYRLVAGIIALLIVASICLAVVLILVGEIRLQEFADLGLGMVLLPLALIGGLYVFIPMALSGYPPKVLLWAAGRRTVGDR